MSNQMELCLVGYANNHPDHRFMVTDKTNNWGHISYDYFISKYNITQEEYCEFLNAVAIEEDTHNLHFTNEDNDFTQNQYNIYFDEENKLYKVKNGFDRKPIVNISFFNACRFCNWLHNNKPTNTIQDNFSTENGAYNFAECHDIAVISRNENAEYWIPSDNEWYKAAYYDPKKIDNKPGYWLYPNKSDVTPIPSSAIDIYSINSDDVFNGLSDVDYFQNYNSNAFGVNDMAGNVYEWIEDIVENKYRVVRGGSYNRSKENAASVYRRRLAPELKISHVGFRVCKKSGNNKVSLGLYNTYGDGWKNSSIDIYDSNSNQVLNNETLDFGYGPKIIDLALPLSCDTITIKYNQNNNKHSYENYIKIYSNTDLSGECLFATKEHEEIPQSLTVSIKHD